MNALVRAETACLFVWIFEKQPRTNPPRSRHQVHHHSASFCEMCRLEFPLITIKLQTGRQRCVLFYQSKVLHVDSLILTRAAQHCNNLWIQTEGNEWWREEGQPGDGPGSIRAAQNDEHTSSQLWRDNASCGFCLHPHQWPFGVRTWASEVVLQVLF